MCSWLNLSHMSDHNPRGRSCPLPFYKERNKQWARKSSSVRAAHFVSEAWLGSTQMHTWKKLTLKNIELLVYFSFSWDSQEQKIFQFSFFFFFLPEFISPLIKAYWQWWIFKWMNEWLKVCFFLKVYGRLPPNK